MTQTSSYFCEDHFEVSYDNTLLQITKSVVDLLLNSVLIMNQMQVLLGYVDMLCLGVVNGSKNFLFIEAALCNHECLYSLSITGPLTYSIYVYICVWEGERKGGMRNACSVPSILVVVYI